MHSALLAFISAFFRRLCGTAIDNIDLAQNLFGDINIQRSRELKTVHHHVREFLGNRIQSIRIFAAHQRSNVFRIQPLKMLQQLAHLDGHRHCDLLRILNAVLAPALSQAKLVDALLERLNRRIGIVHRIAPFQRDFTILPRLYHTFSRYAILRQNMHAEQRKYLRSL